MVPTSSFYAELRLAKDEPFSQPLEGQTLVGVQALQIEIVVYAVAVSLASHKPQAL